MYEDNSEIQRNLCEARDKSETLDQSIFDGDEPLADFNKKVQEKVDRDRSTESKSMEPGVNQTYHDEPFNVSSLPNVFHLKLFKKVCREHGYSLSEEELQRF